MLSKQAQKWIREYIAKRAHRYNYRNYTELAIECGAVLVRDAHASLDDWELHDFIDDVARDSVEWPDESTLGYAD